MIVTQLPTPTRRPLRRLPRQLQPDAIRLSYFAAMRNVLGRARQLVEERLVPALPELVAAAAMVHDAVRITNYASKVTEVIGKLAGDFFGEFTNKRLADMAAGFGARTSTLQRQQISRQFADSLGIDIAVAEPELMPRIEAWAAQNASLIKSVPTKYLSEIEASTIDALRTGTRAEDIAADYVDRYGVSEGRAKLIARDQIGKLNAQVNQARQENLGVTQFRWAGSNDERECDECSPYEGKTYAWDDPPSGGLPGEIHPGCRCQGEPILSDIYEALR